MHIGNSLPESFVPLHRSYAVGVVCFANIHLISMTFEKLKSYLYFVFGAFVRTESDGLSLYGSPPFEILPLKPRLSEFYFP